MSNPSLMVLKRQKIKRQGSKDSAEGGESLRSSKGGKGSVETSYGRLARESKAEIEKQIKTKKK